MYTLPKIQVENVEISVIKVGGEDYISLTDMVREIENGSALIEKWLWNKNTIEFLGIWEEMYNPDFNSPEFGGIMAEAGTNRFLLSVKQWIERTNARGIVAKADGMAERMRRKTWRLSSRPGFRRSSSCI